MPKIDVSKNILRKLLGRKCDREFLENYLPYAKAEYEDEDDKFLKIELNDTNRPDLWSSAGLARQLKSVLKKSIKKYDFFSNSKKSADSGNRLFVVDSSRPSIRPYSVGFAIKGKKLDNDSLKFIIDLQEKIHGNYGRKRRSISMGFYRSNLINYPVIYKGVDPDKTTFTPLFEEKEMNLREVLEKTEKGREFGYIIKDLDKYPFLVDRKDRVLSMPPVINSNDVGALQCGDDEIFVELNGVYLRQVLLVANMLCCDLSDLGFEILPMKVEFPEETEFGKIITVPYYFQEPIKCSLREIEDTLGTKMSAERAMRCLEKMGVRAKASGKSSIVVFPPEYRNDYLSVRDVIEDIAIGYGYNNFKREPLSDFNIGRLTNTEILSRRIQNILTSAGFTEIISNYLSSEDDYITKMNGNADECIIIQNPMSLNFRVVRPSVLPSLLRLETESQNAAYPHLVFECGKICLKDKDSIDGVSTFDSLGILESSNDANINKCVSVLEALMYYLEIKYELKAVFDSRFIKGRSANICVDGKVVGILGEICPEVLDNWQLTMPCYAIEINMNRILEYVFSN